MQETGHDSTEALAHWVGRWNAKCAGDASRMIRKRHGFLDVAAVRRAMEAEAELCTPGLKRAKVDAGEETVS